MKKKVIKNARFEDEIVYLEQLKSEVSRKEEERNKYIVGNIIVNSFGCLDEEQRRKLNNFIKKEEVNKAIQELLNH